jgi:hypothetical protein
MRLTAELKMPVSEKAFRLLPLLEDLRRADVKLRFFNKSFTQKIVLLDGTKLALKQQ